MKKLFKLVFSRMTFVVIAILLQLCISLVLPYLINIYYPEIFGGYSFSLEVVFTVLGLVLMIYIINSDMTVEGQLVWVALSLFVPILALVIYFFFVRKKPPKRHKKFYESVSREIKQYQVKYKEEDEHLKAGLGKYYGQFEYIYQATGLKTYENTAVKYLEVGETFFVELMEELKRAKHYIFLEYFIIERGQMWNAILAVLKAKVDEGVEVRVMYDDLGTITKLPSNYHKRLQKLGIKCVRFNSFVPVMSAVHNNRDHRKMTIIDGRVGFISGLNLADEYVNFTSPYGHWKDTGLKLTGDAVKNMLLEFLQLYDVQSMKLESFKDYFPLEEGAGASQNGRENMAGFGAGSAGEVKEKTSAFLTKTDADIVAEIRAENAGKIQAVYESKIRMENMSENRVENANKIRTENAGETEQTLVEKSAALTGGFVCPYGDGPKYFISEYVAENVYLNLINQAEKYLWITTPYLIIDSKLITALRNAALRGVDVRIITPRIPDKKYIHMLTRSTYKVLQEAGVTIMEYKKGFIHSKQVLCDDDIAVVGTINFDYRSLLHHYECGVLLCKTPCLADIKRDFEHVFTISEDMAGFRQNYFTRLICAILKMFTPLL